MLQKADAEFQTQMQQLEALLQEVESISDPAARAKTGQIIQGLMDFHGAGLARIVDRLGQNDPGCVSAMKDLAEDEVVSGLFVLYGLHPQDLSTRVHAALEKVRPYLASHGGNVELLGISDDGEVELQMQGSCHGCPSSAATLKNSIEQAIYEKAPDVTAIRVQGVEEEPKPASKGGFVELLIGGASRSDLEISGAVS